jgi:hypothetical protein
LGAWWYRYDGNPDFGIVALMIRHVADGAVFPTFFYGQPYMGSLEPALGAVIRVLTGCDAGLAATASTALAGFLILPVVWLWARRLAGSAAGVGALAYCILGPSAFYHYMVSARGGYGVAILAGTFVLWQASEAVGAAGDPAPRLRRRLAVMGLAAGVGWWTTPMVSSALLAAALVLLMGRPREVLRPAPLAAGVAGFLAGSAPFWVWNAFHDWASFRYFAALGGTAFDDGFRTLFKVRLPEAFDFKNAQAWRAALAAAAYAVLGAGVADRLAAAARSRERGSVRLCALVGPLLLALVTLLVFAVSFYARLNTPRYLLPLVPGVAVLAGVGTAALAERAAGAAGLLRGRLAVPGAAGLARCALSLLAWLPLAMVGGHHAYEWREEHIPRAGKIEAYREPVRLFGECLRREGVRTVYTPFAYHSLNYLLKEQFCFVDPKGDRVAAYARRGETDERIGVLNHYGGLKEFLSAAGGDCERGGVKWFGLYHGFRPPYDGWEEIRGSASSGADAVADERLSTAWTVPPDGGAMEIAFEEARAVCGLRVLWSRTSRVSRVQVETAGGGANAWAAVPGADAVSPYFWSGPRPFFGGEDYRYERRFPPRTCDVVRIRVTPDGGQAVPVLEVQLFGPARAGRPAGPAADGLGAVLKVVQERGIERLYCDRWPAAAIWSETGGGVAVPLPLPAFAGERGVLGRDMRFDARTAVLALGSDAGLCRRSLQAAGLRMSETRVGPWVLFGFDGRPSEGSVAGKRVRLWWAGFAAVPE